MRTINIVAYRYSELNEDAKIVAVESWAYECSTGEFSAINELLENDYEIFSEDGYFLTIFNL